MLLAVLDQLAGLMVGLHHLLLDWHLLDLSLCEH